MVVVWRYNPDDPNPEVDDANPDPDGSNLDPGDPNPGSDGPNRLVVPLSYCGNVLEYVGLSYGRVTLLDSISI